MSFMKNIFPVPLTFKAFLQRDIQFKQRCLNVVAPFESKLDEKEGSDCKLLQNGFILACKNVSKFSDKNAVSVDKLFQLNNWDNKTITVSLCSHYKLRRHEALPNYGSCMEQLLQGHHISDLLFYNCC